MVGQPLEFGHQGAQVNGAPRDRHVQGRFHRTGEGERVSHRAVTGGAARKPRRLVERRARHQRFDPLVHVSQPLLEPHDRLAIGREAEVPWLNDAGMHRTNRNLVQAFTFGVKEGIRRARWRGLALAAERMAHVPEAEVEPRARIGQAHRLYAVEILSARSRRIAGGCCAPTEGYCFCGQSKEATAISPESSSRTAMCTQPLSPHNPSSARRPAENSLVMARQPCSLTIARGHGRWPSTLLPSILSMSAAMTYPSSFATFWNHATMAGGMYTPVMKTSAR